MITACAKLLEHIICKQIMFDFLTNFNTGLYSKAFDQNIHVKACIWLHMTNLFKFVSYFETKTQTDVVVLDFSKM